MRLIDYDTEQYQDYARGRALTEQQLRDAPKFGKNDYWDWSGRHELVHKHYGVDPIWY